MTFILLYTALKIQKTAPVQKDRGGLKHGAYLPMVLDIFDQVAHGLDVLNLLVGDLHVELVL